MILTAQSQLWVRLGLEGTGLAENQEGEKKNKWKPLQIENTISTQKESKKKQKFRKEEEKNNLLHLRKPHKLIKIYNGRILQIYY